MKSSWERGLLAHAQRRDGLKERERMRQRSEIKREDENMIERRVSKIDVLPKNGLKQRSRTKLLNARPNWKRDKESRTSESGPWRENETRREKASGIGKKRRRERNMKKALAHIERRRDACVPIKNTERTSVQREIGRKINSDISEFTVTRLHRGHKTAGLMKEKRRVRYRKTWLGLNECLRVEGCVWLRVTYLCVWERERETAFRKHCA